MPWSPTQHGLDAGRAQVADTIIFVDVDGVLNVGVSDGDQGPLLLTRDGVHDVSKLWGKHSHHPMRDTIERLVSVSKRMVGHGEEATYSKFATIGEALISDVLVGRLVKLIQASGERRLVVLSSTWQKYKQKVKLLERAISAQLGSPFLFDASSGVEAACAPDSRLISIADFVGGLCAWRGDEAPMLRVLVLEDFHVNAMHGWLCDGHSIRSTTDAEQYICRRASQHNVRAKLIHTYDEWRSPSGLLVQLGTGLSIHHFSHALQFLYESCDDFGESTRDTMQMSTGSTFRHNSNCWLDALHIGKIRAAVESPAKVRKLTTEYTTKRQTDCKLTTRVPNLY